MRVFLAFPLVQYVRDSIDKAISQFRTDKNWRWVPSDLLHVTLLFLGEKDDSELAAIKGTLRETLQGITAFRIALGLVDAFPNLRNPRVLHVGVNAGTRECMDIYGRVSKALARFISKSEKDYRPHITLARGRSKSSMVGRTLLETRISCEQIVSSVVLFESILHKTGPEYIRIEEYNFFQQQRSIE